MILRKNREICLIFGSTFSLKKKVYFHRFPFSNLLLNINVNVQDFLKKNNWSLHEEI